MTARFHLDGSSAPAASRESRIAHQFRDRGSAAFGVNADRWLVATVFDLATRELLMEEEPVVQLM